MLLCLSASTVGPLQLFSSNVFFALSKALELILRPTGSLDTNRSASPCFDTKASLLMQRRRLSDSENPSRATATTSVLCSPQQNRSHAFVFLAVEFSFRIEMELVEQSRCRELAKSSTFYRSVYSEIEEVGWKHLVRFDGDLTFLSFRILDEKGRVHIMEIQLDKNYPRCPPSVSADVPCLFNLEWSTNSRLKDLVNQFLKHLKMLQEFWSVLDDIDKSLWVVDPKQPSRAMSFRQIHIGNDCFIMLSISFDDPKSLPECRFMGSDAFVNSLRKKWQRNSKRWMKDRSILENLACLLEVELPRSPAVVENDQKVECGICYAQFLPSNDELGAEGGSVTDYTCDNTSCNRAFHSVCLVEWLRSITTTRQSFNVLFGKCPYCSEPIAVKLIGAK